MQKDTVLKHRYTNRNVHSHTNTETRRNQQATVDTHYRLGQRDFGPFSEDQVKGTADSQDYYDREQDIEDGQGGIYMGQK